MNSSVQLNQVNEEYKFKMAYVFKFFGELFSSSRDINAEEVDSEVQAIEKEQDVKHIETLEKEHDPYTVKKESKSKSKKSNINIKVQNNTSREENIELEKEEDREL